MHADHLAHMLKPIPLFVRVGHCVLVGTDDKTYKTAYTRGLDAKKHTSAYSIILNIKKKQKKKKQIKNKERDRKEGIPCIEFPEGGDAIYTDRPPASPRGKQCTTVQTFTSLVHNIF